MRELIIGKDDDNQRIDKYLKKYLEKSPSGFIYKMIRKKNIKLNGKKTKPDDMIFEGDVITLYLSDETLDKFVVEREFKIVKTDLDIIYEDDNIIVVNKPVGMLSHSISGQGFETNVVDSIISYLIEKGDYVPRVQKTFTPSICNRLDRNTSGVIIGAKSYAALKGVNESLRNRDVEKYYLTIVSGSMKGHFESKATLVKDTDLNKVSINSNHEDDKEIITKINSLKNNRRYSFLEIELITGRTHQIRAHLAYLNHPVIGDRKYGNKGVNRMMREKFDLNDQLLHSNRMVLHGLKDDLDYLNGMEFIADLPDKFMRIKKETIDEQD